MDISAFIFLSSGLFFGWALGANNLANVFGTAVGTRMIRFTTAAAIGAVFVVLGAVISGSGTSETVGKLGSIDAPAGAFMAALAAAVAVFMMTRAGLPVSTTAAIVGAVVGWNLFSETWPDLDSLRSILIGLVVGPVLAAGFAMVLFVATRAALAAAKVHMVRLDMYTRLGLIVAGALGAYSLGASNVANVVGVFIETSPFTPFTIDGFLTITPAQQLAVLGGLSIAIGACTYSGKVMHTVGAGLFTLSPVAAWVVVMAHSIVLILFASRNLEAVLAGLGLPTIPLVPISSTEAIIGAVIGVALVKEAHNIRWYVLARITVGWVMTPVIAAVICFVGLFFLQNVFNQEVYLPAVGDAVETHQPG
ncbi:MAG: inorganic phosphate transporter [Betaproteobacteria bacterium]|nr:inorganic phosphate transporter [Betaproteobacteria bacterium]